MLRCSLFCSYEFVENLFHPSTKHVEAHTVNRHRLFQHSCTLRLRFNPRRFAFGSQPSHPLKKWNLSCWSGAWVSLPHIVVNERHGARAGVSNGCWFPASEQGQILEDAAVLVPAASPCFFPTKQDVSRLPLTPLVSAFCYTVNHPLSSLFLLKSGPTDPGDKALTMHLRFPGRNPRTTEAFTYLQPNNRPALGKHL